MAGDTPKLSDSLGEYNVAELSKLLDRGFRLMVYKNALGTYTAIWIHPDANKDVFFYCIGEKDAHELDWDALTSFATMTDRLDPFAAAWEAAKKVLRRLY